MLDSKSSERTRSSLEKILLKHLAYPGHLSSTASDPNRQPEILHCELEEVHPTREIYMPDNHMILANLEAYMECG